MLNPTSTRRDEDILKAASKMSKNKEESRHERGAKSKTNPPKQGNKRHLKDTEANKEKSKEKKRDPKGTQSAERMKTETENNGLQNKRKRGKESPEKNIRKKLYSNGLWN